MRLEHLLSGVSEKGTQNEFGTIPMMYWGMVSRTTLTALNIGEVALIGTSLSMFD